MASAIKIACVVVVCMALVSAPVAQGAISCGQVAKALGPCISYLTGKGPLVSGCCSGVKSLNGAAKTTPDRQAACNCLKSNAGSISGINYGLAAGLPGKCGVSIPYQISPSTDCSK
ncbi:Plant lipid transfer protein/Par allergen [Corchorus olitorius]|uniref:Non-specific lipid-transfer protein n=1 Tax=Corchorus olitorius TaxID=93759 RepID=A0A1R3JHT2_9ROSI|nr:Plant lipid transfer protein/Par allergen [Corchorus olitorius]